MVSTQNTYLPTTRLPPILGNPPLEKPRPVAPVIPSSSSNILTNPSIDPKRLQHLVNRTNAQSAAVLSALSFNGNTPKSMPHLIAMGAKRNHHTDQSEVPIDQHTTLHNDVDYFKVLLQAREKYRAALRQKLDDLRLLRVKQRKICRSRNTSRPSPALVAAALARVVGESKHAESNTKRDEKWNRLAIHDICVSPMSTDVESEVSSHFGDADADISDDKHLSVDKHVSDDKPVIHRA